MAKNVYYRYNPDTDNFERVYPSMRMRLAYWGKTWLIGAMIGLGLFLLVFYCFDSPTEENLRNENAQLRTQYAILSRRLDNSLKVMDHLLDNENRYRELEKLSDAGLVTRLTQNMDLLERQLLAQVQSFDQLREAIRQQKSRFRHIPSVFPLSVDEFTLSSGFGFRRDPIFGSTVYHEGIDLAATTGTPVYATADGTVATARRQAGYGNCVDIDHGFNYVSRYAHLNEFLVREGDKVTRGQLIGRVGSSGKSKAPHLHYEVRFKDKAQDPVNYCFMDLTPEQYSEILRIADNAGNMMD